MLLSAGLYQTSAGALVPSPEVSTLPASGSITISGFPLPHPTSRCCEGPSTSPDPQLPVGYVASMLGDLGSFKLKTTTLDVSPMPGTVASMRPPFSSGSQSGCSNPRASGNGTLLRSV